MNKNELIERVRENLGEQFGDRIKETAFNKIVSAVVSEVFAVIKNELVVGNKVSISKFGIFEVRDRAARQARNPQTGETIDVAATKAPAFKASKALKDIIKGI